LDHYPIFVYPRPGYDGGRFSNHRNVHLVDVPQMDISSTYIRQQIRLGKDVRYLLTEPVYQYLTEMHFYEK
ncbi:MAG: nicotinic acid mononucleotide adenylyltransferase, partial [Bacteroidales bacterium]|nr:nicotinic acid mononucleotide adenylyltransferase [Bacteroidales bacterium]